MITVRDAEQLPADGDETYEVIESVYRFVKVGDTVVRRKGSNWITTQSDTWTKLAVPVTVVLKRIT